MGIIKDSLTFDDVTLVPQFSSVLPTDTITDCKLSKNLNLKIPLLSSAMDTVTESKMSLALAKLGGIGVIHRSLSIEKNPSGASPRATKTSSSSGSVGHMSLIAGM